MRDGVVVYEIMVKELDRAWWAKYRETLRQKTLMIRAQPVELL